MLTLTTGAREFRPPIDSQAAGELVTTDKAKQRLARKAESARQARLRHKNSIQGLEAEVRACP